MRRFSVSLGTLFGLFIATSLPSVLLAVEDQARHTPQSCYLGGLPSLCETQVAATLRVAGQDYQIPGEARIDWGIEFTETSHMKLGRDAAPWLPRVLDVVKKNRPPRDMISKVALITGHRGSQYLVLQWNRAGVVHHPRLPLEFHKVVRSSGGGPRVQWLRSYRDSYAKLVTPSGRAVFKGEPPIAVVSLSDGGSNPKGSSLRLIQLKRNTVDITLDRSARVTDLVDLDGDGHYEVVAIARNVYNKLAVSTNGLFLPVILSRINARFVPACRQFAGAFAHGIDSELKIGRSEREHPTVRSEDLSSAFLALVQIGAFSRAQDLLGELRAAVAAHPSERFTVDQVIEDHAALLAWARNHPEIDCPVSAANTPRGTHGVVGHFDRAVPRLRED